MLATGTLTNPVIRTCYILVAIGILVTAYGATIPVYADHIAAAELKLNACMDGEVLDGWYDRLRALETLRHPFMQGGLSLVLAALTYLGLFVTFPDNGRWLPGTPASKASYFVLGLGVIFLSWLAELVSLNIDLHRGEFPSCADTIFIPMTGLTVLFVVITILCLLVGAALSTRFGDLPVELVQPKAQYKANFIPLDFIWLFLAALILAGTLSAATQSNFLSIPSGIVALYLIVSTRAALLSPKPANTGINDEA